MSEEERNKTERSNKFLRDIIIYAVGNLGSKLVTFLMVPLYTHFVAPAEYGYYDLCFTAVVLLYPILSLTLRDGGFRFLVDATTDEVRRSVVTFVYRTLITNSLIAIILGALLWRFHPIDYLWPTVGLLIAMSFYEVIIQVVRGLGHTKWFVTAGIVNSFLIGLLSILFVVVLEMNIAGIFYANVLSRLFTVVMLELRLGVMRRYFRYGATSGNRSRGILHYSLPLIPGSLFWWLIGSCSKWFIAYFNEDLAQNGQYAVALKFTAILETLAFIFYQTWQETALRQYNSADRDQFFSRIFNNYLYLLMSGVVLFAFVLKLNYWWLVDSDYSYSVNYLFPLGVSTMFFSMSAFYDLGYQCSKKTVFTLPGIIIASVVNLVCNWFFIQFYDVYGIIASSILSYFTLYLYRAIDTRKYFRIRYQSRLVLPFAILVVSGVAFYAIKPLGLVALYTVVVLVAVMVFLPREIRATISQKLRALPFLRPKPDGK